MKPEKVVFFESNLEKSINELKDTDPLKKGIMKAIREVKENSFVGRNVKKNLIPKEIIKKYKYIDVLINCAGIGISGAVEHTTLEEAKKIFDVNVIGQFYITKKFIPFLRESKKGKIINIGSVAGELTIPFQTFYSMTKSAMHKFTEGLRIELKPLNIDVCSVLPGDTKTGFTKNRYQPSVIEDALYKNRIKNSIKRMEKDEQNGRNPISVVKVINKLIKRKKMPVHVTVGLDYKFLVFLGKVLPKRLASFIISKLYG